MNKRNPARNIRMTGQSAIDIDTITFATNGPGTHATGQHLVGATNLGIAAAGMH